MVVGNSRRLVHRELLASLLDQLSFDTDREWQFEPEVTAEAYHTFHADPATHGFYQATTERQANTSAFHPRISGLEALEWDKELVNFFRRQTWPGVFHTD